VGGQSIRRRNDMPGVQRAQHPGRTNQFDGPVAKRIALRSVRLRGMMDLYNLFNSF
jgi:hypothetical protein